MLVPGETKQRQLGVPRHNLDPTGKPYSRDAFRQQDER
jgi:hypothetical protein